MRFSYKIINNVGKIEKGMVDGPSKDQVVKNIIKEGHTIVALREKKSKPMFNKISFSKAVSRDELLVFFRQLQTMLGSGLDMLASVTTIIEQCTNKELKLIVSKVRDGLLNGKSLGQCLELYPKTFSSIYIAMIKAGEQGGMLTKVLDRICIHLEKEQEINNKVKFAAIYPSAICVATFIALLIVMVFIIPSFEKLFESSGSLLPLPTRILLVTSRFVARYWLFIGIMFVAIMIGLRTYLKSVPGNYYKTKFVMSIPMIGKTVVGLATARFARIMGALLQSGIPLLSALQISEEVVGNVLLKDALIKARNRMVAGASMSDPLYNSGLFKPMIIQMIKTGEETGTLDEMLTKIADFYEKETYYLLESLLAFLEPVLVFAVAILVGGVVVATILPVFSMLDFVN